MAYVYIQSEPHTLWTVGFYRPDGKWEPESDHDNPTDAARRVSFLNGNADAGKPDDEHTRKECSYYTHYLVYYDPNINGEKLVHEAYHQAEKQCEVAQKRVIEWMDKHQSGAIPEHLDRHANYWERKVAA